MFTYYSQNYAGIIGAGLAIIGISVLAGWINGAQLATPIGYALLYYIGEILPRGTHNPSYTI